MGLDYKTLEPYGGFDTMLTGILAADPENFTVRVGTAGRDLAGILKQVLLDGKSVRQTYIKFQPSLCGEVEEGITALGDRTEEVKEKLRALFSSETAKE